MGNLCCCFKKNEYYDDEYSESRRILDNPVGINDGNNLLYLCYHFQFNCQHFLLTGDRVEGYGPGGPAYGRVPSGYGSTGNGVYGSVASDENSQSRLYNRVLDQLSARVIDISSLEKSGEQADLTDREQAIHKKLSTVRKSVVLETNKPPQPFTGPSKLSPFWFCILRDH